MARITIKDLPKDVKISKDEMKKLVGGTTFRIDSRTEKSVVYKPPPRRRIGYPDK